MVRAGDDTPAGGKLFHHTSAAIGRDTVVQRRKRWDAGGISKFAFVRIPNRWTRATIFLGR